MLYFSNLAKTENVKEKLIEHPAKSGQNCDLAAYILNLSMFSI